VAGFGGGMRPHTTLYHKLQHISRVFGQYTIRMGLLAAARPGHSKALCRPYGASMDFSRLPRASALGQVVPPLRGWDGSVMIRGGAMEGQGLEEG
jgi:hypothetical protein